MGDDPQQAADVLRAHVNHWPRTRKAATYPVGWARMLTRSRSMPLLVAGLQLVLFIGIAAPDVFGVKGWRWMAGLIAIYLLSEWCRGLAQGNVMRRHTKVFEDVGDLISSIAGMHAGTAKPQLIRTPEDAIGLLLRRACELARVTLLMPPGCEISANLLLPVEDGEQLTGLRVVAQDDYRPGRHHSIIPLDAPGAPFTLSSGKPYCIPFTSEVRHPRLQGRRYRSMVTFPIVVGEPGSSGQTIAVLAMDTTEPYVFDSGAVTHLGPLLSPVAQLIGLALITRRPGTRNVRAQRRSA